MAAIATAGCRPTTWSSSKPQSSSWIERGRARSRRSRLAGQTWPQQLSQTWRELARARVRPSRPLAAQPSRATPTVVPRPLRAEPSTRGSRDGVKAAWINAASRSKPPPWTRPGSKPSTGITTSAGASIARGAAMPVGQIRDLPVRSGLGPRPPVLRRPAQARRSLAPMTAGRTDPITARSPAARRRRGPPGRRGRCCSPVDRRAPGPGAGRWPDQSRPAGRGGAG